LLVPFNISICKLFTFPNFGSLWVFTNFIERVVTESRFSNNKIENREDIDN